MSCSWRSSPCPPARQEASSAARSSAAMASHLATPGSDSAAVCIVFLPLRAHSPRRTLRRPRRGVATVSGPPEQVADLLVGRLREVLVPEADRVERLGGAGADHLVHLVPELGAGR